MLISRLVRRQRLATLLWPRLLPLIAPHRVDEVVDDSGRLDTAPPLIVTWPAEMKRPCVGVVPDPGSLPYWTKYRRFLKTNGFPFRLIDIHCRSWLDQIAGLDMVVWRPRSAPFELDEARRKIFYLNEFLGIKTYPTLRAISFYEDKILQSWLFDTLGVRTPPTITSFSLPDALEGVKSLGDEVVWKVANCSGSYGVELMRSRKARAATRRAFSASGRKTYWPYLNQKGYVYAQALQRHLRTDMRVTVVGPLLFGFYRDAPRKDFRASGMGLERMEAIPPEALEEAWRIARDAAVGPVAVDFIVDQDLKEQRAIELTAFTGVLTQDQLRVDGRSGVYIRRSSGQFEFLEGRFWLQELALAEVLASACGLDTDHLLIEAVLKQRGHE